MSAEDAPLRIAALPGLVAIRGAIEDNTRHRHHALQISIAVAGEIRVDGAEPCHNVVIGPDQPHRLSARDALTLLIDPETRLARELSGALLDDAPLRSHVTLERVPELSDLLSRFGPERGLSPELDPRIADVLGWIDTQLREGRTEEVTLPAALRRACLSESRFLHLLREQTGTTWRRLLIWHRALHAMRFVSEGRQLTEAAHLAGYADSAHFSRRFKELFGFPPSGVQKKSRFVQADELLGEQVET